MAESPRGNGLDKHPVGGGYKPHGAGTYSLTEGAVPAGGYQPEGW